MGKAIPTVEGWHSQHMVFAMDFSAWNCFTEDEKAAARNGVDDVRCVLLRASLRH